MENKFEWKFTDIYKTKEDYKEDIKKVKEKLEMRASTMGMEDYIYRVVVPEQTEIEVTKDGKEKEKTKKIPEIVSGKGTWQKSKYRVMYGKKDIVV